MQDAFKEHTAGRLAPLPCGSWREGVKQGRMSTQSPDHDPLDESADLEATEGVALPWDGIAPSLEASGQILEPLDQAGELPAIAMADDDFATAASVPAAYVHARMEQVGAEYADDAQEPLEPEWASEPAASVLPVQAELPAHAVVISGQKKKPVDMAGNARQLKMDIASVLADAAAQVSIDSHQPMMYSARTSAKTSAKSQANSPQVIAEAVTTPAISAVPAKAESQGDEKIAEPVVAEVEISAAVASAETAITPDPEAHDEVAKVGTALVAAAVDVTGNEDTISDIASASVAELAQDPTQLGMEDARPVDQASSGRGLMMVTGNAPMAGARSLVAGAVDMRRAAPAEVADQEHETAAEITAPVARDDQEMSHEEYFVEATTEAVHLSGAYASVDADAGVDEVEQAVAMDDVASQAISQTPVEEEAVGASEIPAEEAVEISESPVEEEAVAISEIPAEDVVGMNEVPADAVMADEAAVVEMDAEEMTAGVAPELDEALEAVAVAGNDDQDELAMAEPVCIAPVEDDMQAGVVDDTHREPVKISAAPSNWAVAVDDVQEVEGTPFEAAAVEAEAEPEADDEVVTVETDYRQARQEEVDPEDEQEFVEEFFTPDEEEGELVGAGVGYEEESDPDRTVSGIWTIPLLCAGMALIACTLLIPAADSNRRLAYERERLRLDLDQIQRQITVNSTFLDDLKNDATLAQRIAQRQMRVVPAGMDVIPTSSLSGAEQIRSPFAMVTVPPAPALPPYRPVGGLLANLCRDPKQQVWLIGSGLMAVAVGLVCGSSSPAAKKEDEPTAEDSEPDEMTA